MSEIYLKINDIRITAIPVEETNDEVQSLRDLPHVLLPSQVSPTLPFGDSKNLFLRKGVRTRLEIAINALPEGLGMVLISAYRPYGLQKKLFDRQVSKILSEQPGVLMDEAKVIATEFVSNPDVFAPHLTGAAIDVALVDLNGTLLDMGNLFQYDHTAKTDAPGLTQEQRENRSLLIKVMSEAGFVNYPYEWWHWSYGDKYWAYTTGKTAIYGPVTVPEQSRTKANASPLRRAARWIYRLLPQKSVRS